MHICLSVSSLFACLLSLVPLTTLAVSTVVDGLRIESRESSVNLETGLREYTGNVRVHYQNMIISAERLEERRRDGRVERIVATGSPVRFDQRAPYQSGIRKAVASKDVVIGAASCDGPRSDCATATRNPGQTSATVGREHLTTGAICCR